MKLNSKRIIPVLLIRDQMLIKTIKFNRFKYIGDVINTVKIFNELEADEIIILDTTKEIKLIGPQYDLLKQIAKECFAPISYGGGISKLSQAKKLFDIGIEKICLNTFAFQKPELVSDLSKVFGSQAIIASIDVKKKLFSDYSVRIDNAQFDTQENPVYWAQFLEKLGVGEILLTSIDKEGTWTGFDKNLVSLVSDSVSIPVIAHGGAGTLNDIRNLFHETNVSAVGLGSMVVYQNKDKGVLINLPKVS
jgi:cyclase